MALNINGALIEHLGHSCFRISTSRIIYIDPYEISGGEKADLILVTHPHYDHCSISDIKNIAKDGTVVVCPPDAQSLITKIDKKIDMQLIEAGNKIKIGEIKIEAVPAYNNAKPFHPKSEGWLGYVISFDSISVYHAGDTDRIKEMERLTGYAKQGNKFIALLPVGGKMTMNADEAAQTAKMINADLAVPMHYGTVVGTLKDAEKFVELCKADGINAEVI